MTTAAAVALSTAAQADFGGKGFYTGLTAGYSSVSSKIKALNPLAANNNPIGEIKDTHKNKGGFNGSLLVGYGATFGKGFFAGEGFISYDTAKSRAGIYKSTVNIADFGVENGKEYNIDYSPRLGLGLAVKGGFYFMPTLLGYIRLGLEYNFGKLVINTPKKQLNDKTRMRTWSLTPGIGVEGQVNEKTSWLVGVDYRVAFKTDTYTDAHFKNKPSAFIAKAGLSYHF